jgi:hypothetical protein
MTECLKEENKANCNCSYPCEKKGMCCLCISYHRKRRELPACYFPNNIERTYDRSIDNFIRINKR